MPGLTPYRKIRYPLIGETINDVDIKNMATDMDSSLRTSATLARFSKAKSSFQGIISGSVVKATDTFTLPMAVNWDTGSAGPGGLPFWSSTNPTRLTAPVTGLYLCAGDGNTSFTDVPANTQYVRLLLRVNGTTVRGWDQCPSRNANSVGQYGAPALKVMVPLTAGQYVEFGIRWSSTQAGPLSSQVNCYVALMAVL